MPGHAVKTVTAPVKLGRMASLVISISIFNINKLKNRSCLIVVYFQVFKRRIENNKRLKVTQLTGIINNLYKFENTSSITNYLFIIIHINIFFNLNREIFGDKLFSLSPKNINHYQMMK